MNPAIAITKKLNLNSKEGQKQRMSSKKTKPMTRLSKEQIRAKLDYINRYMTAQNAADGSNVDANSNVSSKNVATLGMELWKDGNIQVNRTAMQDKIEELFSSSIAKKYNTFLEDHLIYKHDETSNTPGTPYCVAISMYPFLEHGMTKLGGEADKPNHLGSFNGSFVNLVFAISSQFAGAVATVEYLLYFDYFARKTHGKDYLLTHKKEIDDMLQKVIYCLNQPAAARGFQSVFWNISVFDKYFFDSLFGNFMFPDGTAPVWESLSQLQEYFLDWLRIERTKKLLTFPVLTEASLNDPETKKPKDMAFARMIARQRAKGLSLFSYNDINAASLSSCCRLKSDIDSDSLNEFSFSLGAGGVSTGSTSVMSTNLHRAMYYSIEQVHTNVYDILDNNLISKDECIHLFHNYLEELIDHLHMFQVAHRKIVEDYIKAGLLPVYDAGFIQLNKQFVTLGVNGLNEAAEMIGIEVSNNEEYKKFVADTFAIFKNKNKLANKRYGIKFNTECVPGESLGVKFAMWDKQFGMRVKRECYNSYIYLPECDKTTIADKFEMHGGVIADSLDGGQALHLNIAQLPDEKYFLWLRELAAEHGTTYWTTNVKATCCESCGRIDFRTLDTCPACGSTDISYATRVIGYCKKIPNYSEMRRKEHALRYYH